MAFPAFGVTVPEAFLACCVRVVHLLAQDEESAQRPGCSFGSVLGRVRDVGFRLCYHYGARASRVLRKHSDALQRYGKSFSGGTCGADGNRTNPPVFSCRWPRSMRYPQARPGRLDLRQLPEAVLAEAIDRHTVDSLGRVGSELPVEYRPGQPFRSIEAERPVGEPQVEIEA